MRKRTLRKRGLSELEGVRGYCRIPDMVPLSNKKNTTPQKEKKKIYLSIGPDKSRPGVDRGHI